jgi:hypothetical protein
VACQYAGSYAISHLENITVKSVLGSSIEAQIRGRNLRASGDDLGVKSNLACHAADSYSLSATRFQVLERSVRAPDAAIEVRVHLSEVTGFKFVACRLTMKLLTFSTSVMFSNSTCYRSSEDCGSQLAYHRLAHTVDHDIDAIPA